MISIQEKIADLSKENFKLNKQKKQLLLKI